jgi:hypothetical protein
MNGDDIEQTAELLKRFEPGFLPYPVFEQIARIVALPIVEFVPLKMTDDGKVLVLLTDPYDTQLFAGELHTPGTVIRATDMVHEAGKRWAPFERILHDELSDTLIGPPCYAGSVSHVSKRGAEQAQVYWVEVLGEPHAGRLYPTDPLPANCMQSQIGFINLAVEKFTQAKATQQ